MAENFATNSGSSALAEEIQANASPDLDIPAIPTGFTTLRSPHGRDYLIPTFLADATCYAYHREHEMSNIMPDTAAGGPHRHLGGKFEAISEGLLEVPADPPFSDREILKMHAEVKALQQHLGISYKDAANRLHMAALERLKAERQAARALTVLREKADQTIFQEIYPAIMAIDRGDLDEELPDMPSRAGNGRPQA